MANPVPGTIVPSGSLVSPGGTQGAGGPTGPSGPTQVSADAGNLATLGSDNLILVPQSSIWSMRNRNYNGMLNPNFEVDQRNYGSPVAIGTGSANSWIADRWLFGKNAATARFNISQDGQNIVLPGTNFLITQAKITVQVAATQAALAAGESIQITQSVEGPRFRELAGDVHSLSILALCQVPFTFAVRLTFSNSGYTLTKLCPITVANQWTLFTFPNLPIWTPSGTPGFGWGAVGYVLGIGLGAGSTWTAPSNDVWNPGNFVCGPGCGNFASLPVNTILQVAVVQHEPGPYCTPFIDKPFNENYEECLRYFQKTWYYIHKLGTITAQGQRQIWQPVANTTIMAPVSFMKPVAVTNPPVTIYNPGTGNPNAYSYNGGAADTGVTSVQGISDCGYGGFVSAGAPAAGSYAQWHHTVGTGW